MKVAVLTSTFLPKFGGAELAMHNIVRRLHGRGLNPTVICSHTHYKGLAAKGWTIPYPVESIFPGAFSLFERAPALGFAAMDAFLAHKQRTHHFDVWLGFMAYPTGVVMGHALPRLGAPYLVCSEGEDIQRFPDVGYGVRLDPVVNRRVERWLPKADALIALTDSVAEEYREMGYPEDRIRVIPHGVDLKRFELPVDQAAVRAHYGWPVDKPLFVCVCRNHPKKGLPHLVQALDLLARAGRDDFHLAFVGPDMPLLQPEIEARGLTTLASSHPPIGVADGGGIPDLPNEKLIEVYKAADAFVFPSLGETFGIVMAEAMAAGLPVVTTTAPGCRDVVRKDADGLVVAPGDAPALAEAMARLLDDPDLRADYREKALRRARDFDWEHVADLFEAAFARVLA